MGTAAALAFEVLSNLPSLIAAGQAVIGLIENTNAVIAAANARGGDPTAEEWAAVRAESAALKAIIDSEG